MLIEHSAGKLWRPGSDAALCSILSGTALLPISHKKDARLIWVKFQISCQLLQHNETTCILRNLFLKHDVGDFMKVLVRCATSYSRSIN